MINQEKNEEINQLKNPSVSKRIKHSDRSTPINREGKENKTE